MKKQISLKNRECAGCNVLKRGFTLIEVVLAIGVLGIAVLSLVMMFGPTMKSVRQVVSANEAIAATNAFNDFLQDQARGVENAAMTAGFQGKLNAPSTAFADMLAWLDTDSSNTTYNGKRFYVFTTAEKNNPDITRTRITATTNPTDNPAEIASLISAADADEHIVGSVLRFELYQMPATTPPTYDYTTAALATEAHLPMIVKILSVDAGQPNSESAVEVLTYNTAVLR